MGTDIATVDRYYLGDRLENVAAHLAIGKAKTAGDRFGFRDIDDAELSSMYRSDWMARKIVDIPVNDCLRPWREWQADAAVIEAIEAQEKRFGVRAKLALALKWARLHGGSAILIFDGSDKPSTPLNRVRQGGLRRLVVLNRREITPQALVTDPYSEVFRSAEFYTVNSGTGIRDVHHSRVIPIIGAERPDADLNPDGWGDSVLHVVYDAIHHAALTSAGIAELVHEAKIDIIKVKGLAAQASTPEGARKIAERFSLANMLKSINNTLLLDDSETWERRQTSFAGLPDVLKGFLQIVAGASDIPATRLLGQAPGGLNASGESDTRNYYDALDGYRTDVIGPALERIDSLLWQDIGGMPKDAFFEWGPLWQMSEKDRADVADKKASTTQKYINMGVWSEEIAREVITNQLVEDGTYPGLEAAIESLRSTLDDPDAEPEAEDGGSSTDRANIDRFPRLLASR